MGDLRNKIARLAKGDRPTARKTRSAKASPAASTNPRAASASAGVQNRRNTRSTKVSGPTPEAQGSAPDSAIDGSPLASAPDDIEEAAVESHRTTREAARLDNGKKDPHTSVEQVALSEDEPEIAAYGMPSAAKSQLVAGVDFILDQMEKENIDNQLGSDAEADSGQEEGYEDESSEESEPAIILEYQVTAADRLRNTSVSSTFTYREHRRAIAGAMGFVDPKDVDRLELAWKISTAKKNELPAEFSGPKDLTKITNAYCAALEKERKKKADWEKKVKAGKAAGKKAPLPQDIVIIITNVGDEPKRGKGKGKVVDDDKQASAAETKTDVTFYKSARATFPCAQDPMAVCFLDPFGNHNHVTPTDLSLWEALSKQNPEKYSFKEVPEEIRASMKAGVIRRSAATKQAPNQSGTAPSTASSSTPSNGPAHNTTFPGSAFPFPGYFGVTDPSVMPMYPPGPFPFNPFIRSSVLGFDGPGFYGAPPSPARQDVTVDYPQVAAWLELHVDSDPERVSEGESYAHFGPILERAGFRRINQLVSNKHVQITAETLKGIDIEVGFGSNILRWAAADSAKAERNHARVQYQKRAAQAPFYEGWNA